MLWELRRSTRFPGSAASIYQQPCRSGSPLGILHPTVRPHELVQGNGILLLVNLVGMRPQTPLGSFPSMDFPGAFSTPSARLHGLRDISRASGWRRAGETT